MISKETIGEMGQWFGKGSLQHIVLYEETPWKVIYSIYNSKNKYLDICYNNQIWLGERLNSEVPPEVMKMYHFWRGMLTS
jgi:hypothetical protein